MAIYSCSAIDSVIDFVDNETLSLPFSSGFAVESALCLKFLLFVIKLCMPYFICLEFAFLWACHAFVPTWAGDRR